MIEKELAACCVLLAVGACGLYGEGVELRASDLPEETAAVEISLTGGEAPRTATVHIPDGRPGARPLRIALRVAPGERVRGLMLLDARGRPLGFGALSATNGSMSTRTRIRVTAGGATA